MRAAQRMGGGNVRAGERKFVKSGLIYNNKDKEYKVGKLCVRSRRAACGGAAQDLKEV